VEDRVLAETAGGKTATFWVFLRESADLGGAAGGDWQARGRAVHAELQRAAAAAQGPIIALLQERGAPHQAFWAASRVQVTGGRDLLLELARRPDVARIIADRSYRTQPPAEEGVPEDMAVDRQGASCACRQVTRS
jgi:hypothetical protein